MMESNIKVSIQKFGNFLSSMIMPNISAFIVWGLMVSIFAKNGFLPNENIANLANIMLVYLLPLLISFTGGKIVYGHRGAVVGSIATLGIIVSSDIPLIVGAMIMGPLGGYLIKIFDQLVKNRILAGFEMLINNFSAGILGGVLAVTSILILGPFFSIVMERCVGVIDFLLTSGYLPLLSIFIEPAKVLFLNNTINHGVFLPIGMEQVARTGKSVLFLIETNPGPGLGILLAYCFFGKGMAKKSAFGSSIIQFFGGIHELYFPYILMRPLLFIAVIFGGMSGVFTFVLLDGGLLSPASPGSILAIFAMTPHHTYMANLLGVVVSSVVSLIISVFILKMSNGNDANFEDVAKKINKG